MKDFVISKIIPSSLAILGIILLYNWLNSDITAELQLRLPGADGAPIVDFEPNEPVKLEGTLVRFDGVKSNLPGIWPKFRGPNSDGINKDKGELAQTWSTVEPKVLWTIDVGEGYAGAAVLNGCVYILDYDREKKADVIRCLSLADGKDIWQYSYPVKVKRQHGMSRTIPAVTEKYIVTLGPKCHVTCLNSTTGEFYWMLNLVREFGTDVPRWYAGQCPLIENNKAIIAPGGDSLMIAVDCETGEIIWKTPNPSKWLMTHSSIIPMEFKGERTYVYCGGTRASGGVVGISAKDGSILWENTDWKMRVNVPSPVIIGEDLIFLSAGYNAGSMMLRLFEEDGVVKTELLFRLESEIFGAEQQTPIFYEGHIYGVRMDGQLVCLDINGKIMWTSTSANKFGGGSYVITGGVLYLMNDSGTLSIVRATPERYEKIAEVSILDGIESWGPIAVAHDRLILRDLTRMICIDISEDRDNRIE